MTADSKFQPRPRQRGMLLGALLLGAWLFGRTLMADNAGSPPARVQDFAWEQSDDELRFRIEFQGSPKLSVKDQLIDKRYFYLDFYGVEPPPTQANANPGQDYKPDATLIYHVKRLYYAEKKVLRFVFYARGDLRFNVSVVGTNHYRVQVTPIKAAPLDQTSAGKVGGTRKRVIIDPGHGGKPGEELNSMGARTSKPINGRHYYEKDIVLDIAKKLEALLKKSPNLEPLLTRRDDSYVSLGRRIEIANELQGDLFVSIHLNATDSRRKDARGFEIYYLSDSRKATNKLLLALENDEHLPMNQHASGDESLREILRGLADDSLRQRQAESNDLAIMVNNEFLKGGPFRSYHRGVKSAAFRVLMNYGMPAVLVECGFIDNPAEAEQMIKPEVQQRIASLIFNGINRYFAMEDPEFRPLLVQVTD